MSEYGIYFDTESEGMDDMEKKEKLSDSSYRVLRGGSFNYNAANVRSAYRSTLRPDSRVTNNGFRASRTLPPAPLTALLPAEGGRNLKN